MKLGCKNVRHQPCGGPWVCVCGWVVISSLSLPWIVRPVPLVVGWGCEFWPVECGQCAGFHLPVGAFNDQLKALQDRRVGHVRERGSCRSLEP